MVRSPKGAKLESIFSEKPNIVIEDEEEIVVEKKEEKEEKEEKPEVMKFESFNKK